MPTFILPLFALLTTTSANAGDITVVRETADTPSVSTMAIALWCQPTGDSELARKVSYLAPNYEGEINALAAVLEARADVDTLVVMNNPTAEEINAWMAGYATSLNGEHYRLTIVAVSCLATGGDTDEERLLTADVFDPTEGGVKFYDFVQNMTSMSAAAAWFLDASRNLEAAMPEGMTTYGPTADDVVNLGAKDAFAVSSSPPGKYGEGGLISAVTFTLAQSGHEPMTLDHLYFNGARLSLGDLEPYTSLGLMPNDAWSRGRLVLPGWTPEEPVVLDQPDMKHVSRFRPGHGLIVGGGAMMATGGVFAWQASENFAALNALNAEGGTQEELDRALNSYRIFTGLAVGAEVLGTVSAGTGIAMVVANRRASMTSVTLSPSGYGVMLSGNW